MSPFILMLSSACVIRLQSDVEPIEVDQAFSSVEIFVDAGEVRVQGSPSATGADGEAALEWHGSRPDLSWSIAGDVLIIEATCPRSLYHCSVDLDLVLPEGVPVLIDTGAGDVGLERMHGGMDLSTGAGQISVADSSGSLTADTGAGDILGSGLQTDPTRADTGAGRIDLVLVSPFQYLWSETGAGDIDLLVPQGSYDLETDTGAGDIDVDGITDSSGAAARIEAHTGAGDILIRGYQVGH